MNLLRINHHALTAAAVGALLAGCGGAQGAMDAPIVAQPASPTVVSHGASWMLPEAKGEDLLYVTSFESSYVSVFSYPEGKLVGSLGGFSYTASGECSDKHGNVFVVAAQEVVEYAHAGTTPIATLRSDTYPNGCAVDPVSGNLALAGGSPHDYQANVAIFAHAKGPPSLYSDPTAPEFDFCTYDDRGNLFANEYGSETFALDELANGSGSLTPVDVNQGNQTISAGGAVQWDGEYLILGDPHGNGSRHGPTTIYQVALSGSKGSIVRTIELYSGKTAYGKPNRNPGTPVEFWIQGKTIVNPLKYSRGVAIWRYPGGGRPTKNIFRLRLAYGITLSSAPK